MTASIGLSAGLRARLGTLAERLDAVEVEIVSAGWWHTLLMFLSRGRDVTLGSRIYAARPYDPSDARAVARLAHELTHVSQRREWGPLRYYAMGLAARLAEAVGRDPYGWRRRARCPFSEYGMEQQARIVEECFLGDPDAAALSPWHPESDLAP